MINGPQRHWLFLYFILSAIGFLVFIEASASASDSDEEFVGLDSKATQNSSSSSRKAPSFDEILMDESVSISLSCEKSLGSSEEALKSFVMKSIDFTSEETLADLERPACRPFFDRNGSFLTKGQVRQLMENERGMRILEEGEVLEFFNDFSDFTLKDFEQFPKLKIAKIRDLSSISSEILLTLVREGGYRNVGRLERIPEMFGERVFEHESWLKDPEIWQLFTLEGVAQIHSIENVEKFSNFLASREKFESLIYRIERSRDSADDVAKEVGGESKEVDWTAEMRADTRDYSADALAIPSVSYSTSAEPDRLINSVRSSTLTSEASHRSSLQATPKTSVPLCRAFARNSNLIARWSVQMEEMMLYMMEIPDLGRRNNNDLTVIQKAVRELLATRSWLKNEVFDRCTGATVLSESETLQIGNLKTILESPMSWRLKEALRISPNDSLTPMTNFLKTRLNSFPSVVTFYRHAVPLPNDHLLTHFFLINGIDDLGSVFEQSDSSSRSDNEKVVLSIAIRRVLFLLLSPTSESSDVIQGALNYVLSTHSPLLATSDSTEIIRWFRQAQDLQAIPVLDQLIRNFGHEFDVSREIRAVFNDPVMRGKLFNEAQSSYVRLLAALASNLAAHLTIATAPRSLVSPFLDPMNALLKTPIQPLPVVPGRRPKTVEELDAHAREMAQVTEHNLSIARFLSNSLTFLKTCVGDDSTGIKTGFSGFMQSTFRINFSDSVGVDAGGLRRTWLSALFRTFGDSQRQLFPVHLSVEGGRTPSALLDPEIMAILGTMHGKALQIGVKPDWFFNPRYTQQLLYFPEAPTLDVLLQLTEEMYGDILGSLDSIMGLDSEAEAVEYFNESGFPTIVGLQNSAGVDADANDAAIVNDAVVVSDTPASIEEDSDNDSVMADIEHELQGEQAGAVEMEIGHIGIGSAGIAGSGIPIPIANIPQPQQTAHSQPQQVQRPLRHSFSRMLVFNARFLAQPSIYSGPRETVTTLLEIAAYRKSVLTLFAQNLLDGRIAYWRNFGVFFEETFRGRLEPEFLHGLFEPPRVTIEEIITRINFNRDCDSIFLIDDGTEAEASETEDENIDLAIAEDGENPSSSSSIVGLTRKRSLGIKAHSKARAPVRDLQNSNISARTALIRILSSSLTTPAQLSSLLSFATGCPQLPPAGLDALRLSVSCFPATPESGKMSKSHTCSSAIDFYASVGLRETKAAFLESVLSSSGFGFD